MARQRRQRTQGDTTPLSQARQSVKKGKTLSGDNPYILGLDQAAVVERYAPLVESLVWNVRNRFNIATRFIDDMRADGNFGLLDAYQRYNPESGCVFSTFAYYRIKGSIIDGLRRSGGLRRRSSKTAAKLTQTSQQLAEDARSTGPIPTDRRGVLGEVDQAVRQLGCAWLVIQEAVTKNAEEQERRLPLANVLRQEDRDRVRDAIGTLNEMERFVIEGVYFRDMNLARLGEEIDRSRSWMCRVHARALQKLGRHMQKDLPPSGPAPPDP